MKIKNFTKIFTGLLIAICTTFIIYSCSKTASPIAPASTCINRHLYLADSICNMGGIRPSFEHHLHTVNDSGKVVSSTLHDTSGINFQVFVGADRSITYNYNVYNLIDSTKGVLHFVLYNIPTDNQVNIFYYAQKDSFVITSYTNTYQPQSTITDLDTLFGYW